MHHPGMQTPPSSPPPPPPDQLQHGLQSIPCRTPATITGDGCSAPALAGMGLVAACVWGRRVPRLMPSCRGAIMPGTVSTCTRPMAHAKLCNHWTTPHLVSGVQASCVLRFAVPRAAAMPPSPPTPPGEDPWRWMHAPARVPATMFCSLFASCVSASGYDERNRSGGVRNERGFFSSCGNGSRPGELPGTSICWNRGAPQAMHLTGQGSCLGPGLPHET